MRVGRNREAILGLTWLIWIVTSSSGAAADVVSPTGTPGLSGLPRWERLDGFGLGGPDSEWFDIAAAADGTLVAVGLTWGAQHDTAAAWRSPDGLTWTEVALPASVGDTSTSAGGIVYGPTEFVAIGDARDEQGRDRARIWTSLTGETWTPATAPPPAAGVTLNEIATMSSGYLVVGYRYPAGGDALAWSSTDGDSWTREVIDTHGPEVVASSLVVRPDGSVLAAGGATRSVADESARFRPRFWTRDARGWRRHRTSLDRESLSVVGLVRVGERYYARAFDPRHGGTRTYVSTDAISWQRSTTFDGCSWTFTPLEQSIITFCDGAVLTSPDGITWTSTPEPAFLHAAVSEVVVRPGGSLMALGSLPEDAPEHRLVTWIGTYD